MVNDGDYVMIFNSIHRVLKAEKVLKAKRLKILLIPVPRKLSSDCGLAIRCAAAEKELVVTVLAADGLLPEETFIKVGNDFRDAGA